MLLVLKSFTLIYWNEAVWAHISSSTSLDTANIVVQMIQVRWYRYQSKFRNFLIWIVGQQIATIAQWYMSQIYEIIRCMAYGKFECCRITIIIILLNVDGFRSKLPFLDELCRIVQCSVQFQMSHYYLFVMPDNEQFVMLVISHLTGPQVI